MNDTSDDREFMEYDVVIVGAGPAGLSAAIRLKQRAAEAGSEVSVTVLEKGSEVGAHILSGAVIDPVGLNKLFPDWKERGAPVETKVKTDKFIYLGAGGGFRLPNFLLPPLMSNHGNYIVSLGNVCRWLAEQAEALGVEIYPGFSAAEVVYNDDGSVKGVATGDMGIGRDGSPKDGHMRGMELHGKYTLFAEGARGSLSKQMIAKYNLDEDCDPPKFGLGVKELWEVTPDNHKPGLVQHSFGWPLDNRTGGGAFMYHFDDNLVTIGFVVHLNYANPYISPFEEFQRMKTHPAFAETFEGGKRIAYGARVITEGGYQSVPKLTFPGGALVGCAAGLVNLPRIKGTHNAMLSAIMAADETFSALEAGRQHDELTSYQTAYDKSEVVKDLWKVRNAKPLWSKFGTFLGGLALTGLDLWTNTIGFSFFGTMKHGKSDADSLRPASEFKPINYPRPDGELTFDRLSSVFLSGTNHEEDQPVHLQLIDDSLQKQSEFDIFAGPSTRYCPAAVYEWITEGEATPKFQINAQNCVHCKTCDIKDPNGNINWAVPEGGGGPNYPNM